ncbi:hypothetical protein JVU11DRAFT_7874 [Chiua virens]|nr:hypothetical protein JVU11DRAFT_7874 [Chiua virens]
MSPSTEVCEQDNGRKCDSERVSEGEPSSNPPRSRDTPLSAEVRKPLYYDPIPDEWNPADWLGNIFSNVERKYAEMQARLKESAGSTSVTTSRQECEAGSEGIDEVELVDRVRVEIFLEMVESTADLVLFPPEVMRNGSGESHRRRIPEPQPEDEIN